MKKKVADTIDLSSIEKRLFLSIRDAGLMTGYTSYGLKVLEEYRVTRGQLEKVAKSRDLKDTEIISLKLYSAVSSFVECEREIITVIGGMYGGLWPDDSADLYKQAKSAIENDFGRYEKLRNDTEARAKEGLLTRCTQARIQKFLTAILDPCRRMLSKSSFHFEDMATAQTENVQDLHYNVIKLHGQIIGDLTEVKGDSSTEAAQVLSQRIWSEVRYPSMKMDERLLTYERPELPELSLEGLRDEVLAKINAKKESEEIAKRVKEFTAEISGATTFADYFSPIVRADERDAPAVESSSVLEADKAMNAIDSGSPETVSTSSQAEETSTTGEVRDPQPEPVIADSASGEILPPPTLETETVGKSLAMSDSGAAEASSPSEVLVLPPGPESVNISSMTSETASSVSTSEESSADKIKPSKVGTPQHKGKGGARPGAGRKRRTPPGAKDYGFRLSEDQAVKVRGFIELLRSEAEKDELIRWIESL